MTFEQDDAAKRIRGSFRIPSIYQGAHGMVHGGIIAMLLDEVMAKVSRFQQDRAVTGELTVKYLKPVPTDEEIVIEGWEVERQGRSIFRQGEIRNSFGVVLAAGCGHFITIGAERFRPATAAVESSKH